MHMTDHNDTYACPWCHEARPLTPDPCPFCGHADATVLPHHVPVLPGGTAVRETPTVVKYLAVVLALWIILTIVLLLKYG